MIDGQAAGRYVRTAVILLAVGWLPLSSCTGDRLGEIIGPDESYWANLYDWDDPGIWHNPDGWSDDKVVSFAYSGHRLPAGFHVEDQPTGHPYYQNTVSTYSNLCDPGECWIELCTDDRDYAFQLSEYSALHSSCYRVLESERETEKYFEFRRVNEAYSIDVILDRVHKCSYLDRTMYDSRRPMKVLGVFGHRPITAAAVRELVEYMWGAGMLEWYTGVASSETLESADAFTQRLLYVIRSGGDYGLCARVQLRKAMVSVDKATGEITSWSTTMRELTGVCWR